MIFHVTAEAMARCERILRNPFVGRIQYLIDPKPVAKEDGLFQLGADLIPCHGCELNCFGEEPWEHVHLITTGENGGMRCTPFSTTDQALTELRSRVRIDVLRDDAGTVVALGLFDIDDREVFTVSTTIEAHEQLSQSPWTLEWLIEQGLLFDARDES